MKAERKAFLVDQRTVQAMKDEIKSLSERVVAWIAFQNAERRDQQVEASRLF